MENTVEVMEFLKDNKFKYLEFLSQIDGFPYVCDISSTILNIYLYKRFGLKSYHIEGDYNDDIHFWLQLPNTDTIVDFVDFQFDDKLCELPVNELKLKLDNNYPFVQKTSDIYKNYYPLEEKHLDYSVLLGSLDDYDFDNYLKYAKDMLIKQQYITTDI